jgi:dCMP deaminase
MGLAILSSFRSKDPNTQVGCCIFSCDGEVVSTGYNGFPCGIPDEKLPWGKISNVYTETKHAYVCHAEANSILNQHQAVGSLRGCTACVTLFPCENCAKIIIQAGIHKLIYLSAKACCKEGEIVSQHLLKMAKIELVKFSETEKNTEPITLRFVSNH